MRARGIARKKVRGVRDEQSNAGVRLADALCGLIRDADEGEPWAMATLAQLRQRGVVTRCSEGKKAPVVGGIA